MMKGKWSFSIPRVFKKDRNISPWDRAKERGAKDKWNLWLITKFRIPFAGFNDCATNMKQWDEKGVEMSLRLWPKKLHLFVLFFAPFKYIFSLISFHFPDVYNVSKSRETKRID